MSDFSYAVLLVGCLLGLVGFIISLICVSMISGFVRSTHTVQYVPHETPADALQPSPDIAAENEQALLDKVGKKKNKLTVVADLDAPLEEINKSDINF